MIKNARLRSLLHRCLFLVICRVYAATALIDFPGKDEVQWVLPLKGT